MRKYSQHETSQYADMLLRVGVINSTGPGHFDWGTLAYIELMDCTQMRKGVTVNGCSGKAYSKDGLVVSDEFTIPEDRHSAELLTHISMFLETLGHTSVDIAYVVEPDKNGKPKSMSTRISTPNEMDESYNPWLRERAIKGLVLNGLDLALKAEDLVTVKVRETSDTEKNIIVELCNHEDGLPDSTAYRTLFTFCWCDEAVDAIGWMLAYHGREFDVLEGDDKYEYILKLKKGKA
jgi:hypothetical protein